MGLCAVGPHALCQRWLLSLFPQPHSSYETLRSPLSTLRFKEKIDIKRVCVCVYVWGAHIDHTSVKNIGLSGYAFHPVWSRSIRAQEGMLRNIQRYNPMRTSQHRDAPALTHTPTRAPWQIITPTASGEQNAHEGPITALDKGHGTPKNLLLCLSPKPCVCFACLVKLDLCIFIRLYILVALKNDK